MFSFCFSSGIDNGNWYSYIDSFSTKLNLDMKLVYCDRAFITGGTLLSGLNLCGSSLFAEVSGFSWIFFPFLNFHSSFYFVYFVFHFGKVLGYSDVWRRFFKWALTNSGRGPWVTARKEFFFGSSGKRQICWNLEGKKMR